MAQLARLSAADAWRALVDDGELDPSWIDAPHRRFAWLPDLSPADRAEELRRAPHVPHAAHPDDGRECAWIASMAPAMERAEAHARAFVDAAARWTPRPHTILWVPASPEGYAHMCHDTKPGVWEPDALVWRVFPALAVGPRLAEVRTRLGATSAASALAPWVLGEEAWHDASAPSPFTPALAVFRAGFGILPSSDRVLVLAFPRVTP